MEQIRRGSGLHLTKGNPVGTKLKLARELRRRMTPAEKHFWEHFRNRRYPGYRFRRQAPLMGFVVDFYCDALQLVIEVDGEIHQKTQDYDHHRDAVLVGRGVRVVRYSNEEVLQRLPEVMQAVFDKRPGPLVTVLP